MKQKQLIAIIVLLAFGFTAPGIALSKKTPDIRRFYYGGDGRLSLFCPKNGLSFKGRFRKGKDIYDRKALNKINRLFGAEADAPAADISLRLIEFLDYLQDTFHPNAKIIIASGYRSPQYNTDLRNKGRLAANASLHQYGMAADIRIQGTASKQVWNFIKKLGFGGTGYYHGKFVHVDVGPARFWDEKTSGVGTNISTHNKLIGIVTDYDVYFQGDMIALRFIRMTSFPVGVSPEFVLERVEENGRLKKITGFKPVFATDAPGRCPQFSDIAQMAGISWKLPSDIPSGRYKIRASFCHKEWKEMPAQVFTPVFSISRPALAK